MEAPKTNSPTETKLHFLDYWRIIRIRKTVIMAVFLLVVLTTTAVTLILPESWSSTVRIAVEKDVSDIAPLGYQQYSAQTIDPFFIQTEFEKIRSKKVLHKVIENLKLNEKWAERYNNGLTLKRYETFNILKGKIDVRQTRNTSLIEIHVFSDAKVNPAQEAADIANEIANVYKTNRVELKREQALGAIETLKEERLKHEKEVEEAQAYADKLRKELKISDIAEGGVATTLEPETLRRLEGARIEVEASYKGVAELLGKLKELATQGPSVLRKSILTAFNDELLSKLMQDLSTTEATLASKSTVYGDSSPEIKQLAAMQLDLNNKVNDRIEGMLSGLAVNVDAKKAQLDSLAQAVDSAKTNDVERTALYRPYFEAKRRLENLQKIMDAVVLRVEQERIDANLPKKGIVEITDQAEPGIKPVSPNLTLNIALGIIVGLIVGVGLAFFIEYLDTSVKTIDDVERALQSPVLGVIPQNVGSLLQEGPESPHAEAYRVLRTNVLFSRKREDANSLTVVSGGAGEGKSTTIFNLSVVFAQNGERVLLVDSDLRRPSLHKLLSVSNSIGLTSYLLGQSTLEQVIQTTSIPTLDFLPSGKLPSSSLGILNSTQMKEFIREAKRRYDFVFFDSPPIMGVSDASILASEVDLAVLVIQYRKYPQAMTLRAKQMVEKVGGTLLGVVLNNINISQDSYYYYYSGYYYDYYSKREEEPAAKKNGEKKKPDEERPRLDLKQKF